MGTVSLRIDEALALQAEREARIESRSKTKQIEYWANLGRVVASKISIADAFAVVQGIKNIKLEIPQAVQSVPIDSDDVFNDLEKARTKNLLAEKVTSARIYFEMSKANPGFLDRVDAVTGKRQAGTFKNGQFKAQ